MAPNLDLLTNRAAHFHYSIKEEYEAGLVLLGAEVKSLRLKHGNLKGSYVSFNNGEAWVKNWQIPRYRFEQQGLNEFRPRKLLLARREILKLEQKAQTKGYTLIPLKVYLKNNRIKILLGVAQGRPAHDKRQLIKERDVERRTRQAIRNWR